MTGAPAEQRPRRRHTEGEKVPALQRSVHSAWFSDPRTWIPARCLALPFLCTRRSRLSSRFSVGATHEQVPWDLGKVSGITER